MSVLPIKNVHLVFKTHLDAGFTELSAQVKHRYFMSYFPQALQTARSLRERGCPERFIWTTGAWILYEYLEQASAQERALMEQAILHGDIAWHALPFTVHSELMDTSLFAYGLSLSQQLDRRFGKTTIAGKMTDVPGHTRGIVPLLAQAGVSLLHLGVNPGSTPPDVPPIFLWRDEETRSEIIVMYQKGSYGELTLFPEASIALAFAHTLDNLGPQTPDQALHAFDHVREHVPGANVFASTLDAFAREILPLKSHLPVITSEMGDTWIHGVGADPQKVSQFRALSRLRRQWISSGRLSSSDECYQPLSNALLQIPEHTWGLDEKKYLPDQLHYSPAQLKEIIDQKETQFFVSSWREQRGYIDEALEALGQSDEAQEAKQMLAQLRPVPIATEKLQDLIPSDAVYETHHFRVGFHPHTGSIQYLQEKKNNRIWASQEHPLALFFYELFSQAEYNRFFEQYIFNKAETSVWARQDFTKPGIDTAVKHYQRWYPTTTSLYRDQDDTSNRFVVEMQMPSEAWQEYGSPRFLTVAFEFPADEPRIHVTLQWFEKQANRLPEAFWLSFDPLVSSEGNWEMHKLGHWISPLDVISHGGRTLHAVDTGVRHAYGEERFSLETLDAPLIAPGEPSLLDFHNRQPDLKKGMHINLFNNVWGTNFPMWSAEDARFRFTLRF